MTNDAPETIYTSQCGKQIVQDGMKRFSTDVQYIRTDHAQAEKEAAVAAEREACAEVAANFFDQQPGRVIAETIRNRSKEEKNDDE